MKNTYIVTIKTKEVNEYTYIVDAWSMDHALSEVELGSAEQTNVEWGVGGGESNEVYQIVTGAEDSE